MPTILYWDPQRWELRPEAEETFDNLRAAKILFDSPEDAAAQLSAVYADPTEWWQGPAVQSARREFVERYAMNSPAWPRMWADFMLAELAQPNVEDRKVRRAAL